MASNDKPCFLLSFALLMCPLSGATVNFGEVNGRMQDVSTLTVKYHNCVSSCNIFIFCTMRVSNLSNFVILYVPRQVVRVNQNFES